MNIKNLFLTSTRSLTHHVIRSFLTTLGIIIGVVSIICVTSIGQGANYKVNKEIAKLGTNFIIVISSSQRRLSQRSATQKPVLTIQDLHAIKNQIDEIALISPGIQVPIRSMYQGTTWETLLGGVNEIYPQIRDWHLKHGNFFTHQDIKSRTKVVVIGATVQRELFKNEDPLEKKIRIKNIPFKVIGVLHEKGRRPDGTDEDDIIFAPFSTVQRRFVGFIGGKEKYGALLMSAKNKEKMEQTTHQITSLLRQTHRIKEHEPEDFTVFSQNDIAQAADAASRILNLLLIIVASISLFVGGIGIMNIMLVTVTERTKEIGIRMALGATTTVILTQFILEAIIICLFGGILGIIIGISLAQGISIFLGWPIFISAPAIFTGLGSSILTGIFFGYYPAYKASQLNPIDALAER